MSSSLFLFYKYKKNTLLGGMFYKIFFKAVFVMYICPILLEEQIQDGSVIQCYT